MESSRIRILIVEDYDPFRAFLSSSLSNEKQFEIVGTASDGLGAVEKAQELQPHLILLDIGLPQLNGIEAARQIRRLCPKSKILFLSQETSPDVVLAALGTGACGYVAKSDAGSELLSAVNAALKGEVFVSRSLAKNEDINFKDSEFRAESCASSFESSGDCRPLLEELLEAAIRVTGADCGNIQLFDSATGELRIYAQRGFSQAFLEFFDRVFDEGCVCGRALKTGRRVVVENVAESPIFAASSRAREIILAEKVRSIQSTPLISASEEMLGMLSTHYREPQVFSQWLFERLDAVASSAVQLIERWRQIQPAALNRFKL